jgi:hypothetical protein
MRASNEQYKRDRKQSGGGGDDDVAGPRPKPAPTKRTGGGSARPGGPRKRR